MNFLQSIIVFLLTVFGLCQCLPRNDDNLPTSFEEDDSEEYGQFIGPKLTNCSCGWTNKEKGRVVGGKETYVNEFPHMVGVVRILYSGGKDVYCGASIITPYHVLTAAHCTVNEKSSLKVITGEHDLWENNETSYTKLYAVKEVIEHPEYDTETHDNDIALLVTKNRIDFNTAVGPVCLPTMPMNDFLVGKFVKVTGWGALSFHGFSSSKLLKVNLRVVSIQPCSEKYDPPLRIKNPTQFCTFRNGKDSCQGDSGGPVTWLDPETNRYTLVGLVSFGDGCAEDIPGVNTDVYAFLPWIQNIIHKTSPSLVSTCAKIH